MKKILYILLAMAVLTGCNKPGNDKKDEDKTLTDKIAGQWHCSPANMNAEIYVSFTDDGKFELYQQITEGAFRLYRGTWTFDETNMSLKGKYNDGESWGSGYTMAMSDDANSMTLTDSASNDHVFSRQEIPAEIKDNSVIIVKSSGLSY